jgi:protein-tyrosine phosphatase
MIAGLNCHRVLPTVFVGPDLRLEQDIELLRSLGVTAILSLQSEEDVKGHSTVILGAVIDAGLKVHKVSISDFDRADLKLKLPASVTALNDLVESGETVYVHCTAGVSRSPTVVAAYMNQCLHWSLESAVNHLMSIRVCCPDLELISTTDWGPQRKRGSE